MLKQAWGRVIDHVIKLVLFNWKISWREAAAEHHHKTIMAEKPEDLSLPASVVARIIKDAVSFLSNHLCSVP